ncbi:unnamed protein product [Cuscuta epithymum]|uniref:WAT1-related protein n=2 Tax=Cuscuta epithymum TaxID=186058 RepID=A0AAV0F5D9_9ASTE|nr:unnamed protein product [Cuscuta epithymum]
MMTTKWRNLVEEMKPVVMMVTVMVAYGGMSILYKVASNGGMSLRVLIAYRFIFAAAVITPLALYIERNTRPKLTRMILVQAFFCALFGGSMNQNLFAESVVLTSPTFASAIVNLIPAFTFILAIPFGLEKVGLRTRAGQAKVAGTLLGIGGAMVLSFYKGAQHQIWSTRKSGHVAAAPQPPHTSGSHLLGVFMSLACVLSSAISLIVQAKMSKVYDCHYSSTALITVMGSLQSVVFAFCTERGWSQWKLGWNLRLLIVLYAGVIASALAITFTMCSLRMRGPLFVSVFNPLTLVSVAIVSTLFLKEELFVGCVIGAVTIIAGLYMVIWGKKAEMKSISDVIPSSRSIGNEEEEEGSHINRRNGVVDLDNNHHVVISPNLNFLWYSKTEEVRGEENEMELKEGTIVGQSSNV